MKPIKVEGNKVTFGQEDDLSQLLGQFLVQQTLKNAELEQALNAIGAGIVQLQLKGGA